MSGKQRLQELQSQLTAEGVRDVKFCFAPGFTKLPSSEVTDKVAAFLSAYVGGQYTVVPNIEAAAYA